MKEIKNILCALLLFNVGLSGLKAQEFISSSGGNGSGIGGTISYSLGEVLYTTNQGTNGSVSHGVQQTYGISIVSKDIEIMCMVYPNPTTDYVTLKIEKYKIENMSYKLYHINGNLLQGKKIVGNETKIAMSNLLAATYFLKVSQGDKEVTTFKIIKN